MNQQTVPRMGHRNVGHYVFHEEQPSAALSFKIGEGSRRRRNIVSFCTVIFNFYEEMAMVLLQTTANNKLVIRTIW